MNDNSRNSTEFIYRLYRLDDCCYILPNSIIRNILKLNALRRYVTKSKLFDLKSNFDLELIGLVKNGYEKLKYLNQTKFS